MASTGTLEQTTAHMARTRPEPTPVVPGGVYVVRLPFSEVCSHMQVAGRTLGVRFEVTRAGYGRAQLLEPTADGSWREVSFPILPGEAGIYGPTTEGGYYCYGEVVQ